MCKVECVRLEVCKVECLRLEGCQIECVGSKCILESAVLFLVKQVGIRLIQVFSFYLYYLKKEKKEHPFLLYF